MALHDFGSHTRNAFTRMSWNGVLNMARPSISRAAGRYSFCARSLRARAPSPSTGATRNSANSSKCPARNFRIAFTSSRAFSARSESEISRPRCALLITSLKLSSSGMFIRQYLHSVRSGTFIVYPPKTSQAPSERYEQIALAAQYRNIMLEGAASSSPKHLDTPPRIPPNCHCRFIADQMRKSEILRETNSSHADVTPKTEIDLSVSLSIEVMATFEIPHGVIWS